MRVTIMAAGLMLIAGAAFAQENGGAPAPRAPAAGAPVGNANAIKPCSMVQPHGQNGMGGAYPVDGLYRENPGNGLYGAYVGDYSGQMQEQLPL